MTGILNSVGEKLKSISDQSQPDVSNQSFATDKVLPSPEMAPKGNGSNSFGEGRGHLVHRTLHVSSFFSGEDTPGKNEKSYEQWIFYVKTMRPSYPEGLLKEAIFGSLKGNTSDIARGLGLETTIDKVLELLEWGIWKKDQPRCPHAGFLQDSHKTLKRM